ncbi:MAG: alpha/beta hydrolase [Alphaproteobacteria bacterium]|nr:alpha/beta hydrolase [Alphaproteobacteria bacterium]
MTGIDEKSMYSPIVTDFLNSIKHTPALYLDTYEAARAELLKIQSFQSFMDDVLRNDYDILLKTGEKIHVRIVRNKGFKGLLPVAFYVHGGGFVMGDAMCYDTMLYKLAKEIPAAFVFVEYSLAPNVKYPKPLNELFSVFIHLLKNYRRFQLNPKKVFMIGDGVGGNLASVLTYYAISKGYHIDSQFLFYPVTNGLMNFNSHTNFQNAAWIDEKTASWFWDAYEPDINNRKNPFVSPYFLDEAELKKMPFTFILTVQNDFFRDDGILYAEKLRRAGVDVLNLTMTGVIHDFLLLHPLVNAIETKMGYQVIVDVMKTRV